jgi:hypothetical protein
MTHNTFIDEDGKEYYRGSIGWFSCRKTARSFGWYDNGIILDGRQPTITLVKIEPVQLTLF